MMMMIIIGAVDSSLLLAQLQHFLHDYHTVAPHPSWPNNLHYNLYMHTISEVYLRCVSCFKIMIHNQLSRKSCLLTQWLCTWSSHDFFNVSSQLLSARSHGQQQHQEEGKIQKHLLYVAWPWLGKKVKNNYGKKCTCTGLYAKGVVDLWYRVHRMV